MATTSMDDETKYLVSDKEWQVIEPLIASHYPPRRGPGRKPADFRRTLDGILYRYHTGCHWNKIPKRFGDDSTMHRYWQEWCGKGIMARILTCLDKTPVSPESL